MPFDDELDPGGVVVHPYRTEWAGEAAALGAVLRSAVPAALAVEHIGSTAVPAMAAKDCLDLMLVVDDLGACGAQAGLAGLGYRLRPEPWNTAEPVDGRDWPKLVFAPPVGARPCNVHVRVAGTPTVRLALLFRDHLRACPDRTAWWSQFKREAAAATTDLAGYGRLKYPAWQLLMALAETWARDTGWAPPTYCRSR